ncbi:hypothetical protein KQX54_019369 [Cotesia glomerata]|uniref:Uncharacterized protein n=1 Tax=Cotesia glomerata TaxID=32391 RepID=A0AAV7IB41_COTGL|nr:hypothetical protein KQX54_019369 [Cotesia glomerata]
MLCNYADDVKNSDGNDRALNHWLTNYSSHSENKKLMRFIVHIYNNHFYLEINSPSTVKFSGNYAYKYAIPNLQVTVQYSSSTLSIMKPQLVSILVAMSLAATFAIDVCWGPGIPCEDDKGCCEGLSCSGGKCTDQSSGGGGGGGPAICMGETAPCSDDDECCEGLSCSGGKCTDQSSGGGGGGGPAICMGETAPCSDDDECCEGVTCQSGTCA